MERYIKKYSLILLIGLALVGSAQGCASDASPEELADGSWGGPAGLANCDDDEVCDSGRWVSNSEFQISVGNEDAELSSTNLDVLEIVSIERITATTSSFFCVWNCEKPRTYEYLSVVLQTKAEGEAELVIDGPAGDQRRLPVRSIDAAELRIVDRFSGELVTSIEATIAFLSIEASDSDGAELVVQADWSIDDPEIASVSQTFWDEPLDTLVRSQSATVYKIVSGNEEITTVRVNAIDTTFEIPFSKPSQVR